MIMSIIGSFIFVIIKFCMWTAIYNVSQNTFEMTLYETLTYTVIMSTMNKIVTNKVELEIGSRVISGDIVVDLLRPMHYITYLYLKKLGTVLYTMVFACIPLLIASCLAFKIKLIANTYNILFFGVSVCISFMMIFLFEFILGMISFWTSQIYGISLIKEAIVSILAGITIPLSFYPDVLKEICMLLPFQAMYYIPVVIYLNKDLESSFIQAFLIHKFQMSYTLGLIIEQTFWLVILMLFTIFVWRKAKKKLIIQGG